MELEKGGNSRPRNVDWKRAAALLYGDWGTSKAYVPGIAFAIAMYSSFWFVLAVGILTALVGVNYIWVCKYFPEGGGVYSSAKKHSQSLAIVGGFLLVADYIVTASLSCFEAFVYFNFDYSQAKQWAILTIFIIGALNFLGPRHSASLAVMLGISTLVVLTILGIFCLPHIPAALANVEHPHRDPIHWWGAFVGCVLALSGVEAIANMTGIMKIDPHSTMSRPSVAITSRKAILPVLFEVVILTTLFGLVMHAIRGMGSQEHEGDMLRYLAEVFVDAPLARLTGLEWIEQHHMFASVVGLVLGGLLLSATNTAIVALVSVLYLMAKDRELPEPFAMLNRFGVPWILVFIAILAPILVIDVQSTEDAVHGLAALYAIGVVGAIAVNLGSCVFNFNLPMLRYERVIMMITFLIIAAIEITIAITKPKALMFTVIVVGLGFTIRAMHKGVNITVHPTILRIVRRVFPAMVAARQSLESLAQSKTKLLRTLGGDRKVQAIMVASTGVTPILQFAVDQARLHGAHLYVLFVREEFTQIPVARRESDDPEAQAIFGAVKTIADDVNVTTVYAVSDDIAWAILDNAALSGVDILILGHSRRGTITRVLRGDLLQTISSHLPEDIRLFVVD